MTVPEKSQQLYIKSYFAASVPEAIEQALRELGCDALLLNSRPAPPEARHLGAYEVVFGRPPEAPPAPVAAVRPTVPAPTASAPARPAPRRIEDLNRRVREIRETLSRGRAVERPLHSAGADLTDVGLEAALAAAGVEPVLAADIAAAVGRRISRPPVLDINRLRTPQPEPQSWLSAAAEEIGTRFEVQAELGRIAAFVGPPGAGKTTSLVKLAIARGLAAGRAVRLFSADTLRIGAAEQLRTYASILGVPFQAVESVGALDQAIAAAPSNALLLIDTPGFSAALQNELGADLAAYLSRRQDIDTHLVLTASMNRADLRSVASRFRAFRPAKMLFTRLDETTSGAAIFCEAVRSGLPLSFFAHGQSVPEDIEPASREHIIESLVSQLPKELKAVA